MTRSEFLKGSAVLAVTLAAGVLSAPCVDRYVASVAPRAVAAGSEPGPRKTEVQQPPAACVQADGSWKNWEWPNVPMLSPRCAQQ